MKRDEILQKLREAKVLTEQQAQRIRQMLPADSDETLVLSVIKGEYTGIAPRRITGALDMTSAEWNEISPSTFERYEKEQERIRKGEQARENIQQTAEDDALGPYRERKAQEAAFQKWYEDHGFESAQEARNFLRDQYNELKEAGVFSVDAQSELEDFIHNRLEWGNYTPETLHEFIQKMRAHGADEDDLGVVYEAIPASFDFTLDEDEAAFLERAQPGYGGIASLDPAQQAAIVAGADTIVDSTSAGELSFWQELQAEGILGPAAIEDRPRLSYYNDGTVFDRATGQVLSEDQWELINTNSAALKRYREVAGVSEVVERLLNSGMFLDPDSVKRPVYESKFVTETIDPFTGDTRTVRTSGTGIKPMIPMEDLAIPTAGGPVEPWQAQTYDYKVGDGRAEWLQFSARERKMRLKYMVDTGLLSAEEVGAMQFGADGGTPLNFIAMDLWEQVSSVSSQFQFSQFDVMNKLGEAKAVTEAAARRGSGSGRGPTYSVPASLREIPDYKTLAQNTKAIFRGELGRDMEDWELAIYADELKNEHIVANERRIQIHKEAWDDAVAGGSVDIDFTAVEDPNLAVQYDIEEAYANEIARQEDVEMTANRHRLLMESIAVGQRMI